MDYLRFVVAVAFTAAIGVSAGHSKGGRGEAAGFKILELDGKPVRWAGDRGAPTVITYAFIRNEARFDNAKNCRSMQTPDVLLKPSKIARVAFEAEVRAAFDMWQMAAGLTFTETPDTATAGILIGAQMESEGRAFANVDYRPTTGKERLIERSLICLNPDVRWKIGFDGGLSIYDIRYTVAHEIGHAIGLDHPVGGNQLMSFTYSERFRDLQEGDVEGAMRIYGARTIDPSQYGPATSSIQIKDE